MITLMSIAVATAHLFPMTLIISDQESRNSSLLLTQTQLFNSVVTNVLVYSTPS